MYKYSHSDDENIFLRYSWFSSTVPGSQLLTPLEIYVNEVTFKPHPRVGAGCQRSQPFD